MMNNPDSNRNLHFRPNRTFICSVVFIDIVEYTKKSFNEQILIKERFNTHLTEAIKDIALNDRIVLDTGDGAAIGCIGDPEDALSVAMRLRDALMEDGSEIGPDLKVRMGINLGPVRILKDINNQMNMIGDGINAAERIMSFSEPGQLLVSRSYYDMLSCLSQEYAELFHYQGSRTDKHVREHDLYAVEHEGIDSLPEDHKPEIKAVPVNGEDAATAGPSKPSASQPDGVHTAEAGQTVRPRRVMKMFLIGGAAAATVTAAAVFILSVLIPPEITRGILDNRFVLNTILTEALKTTADGMPAPPPASIGSSPAPVKEETAAADSKALTAISATETIKAAPALLSAGTSPAPVKEETAATSDEETTHPTRTTAKRMAEPLKKAFKAVSSKAGDILFTVTGMKSKGSEVTVRVQSYNSSNTAQRIALYDDAYWWTKSQITDGAGEKHEVDKVSFSKGDEKIAMSLTGTQGIPIDPQKTITAYMTFKKAKKGVKTLVLHPFIYRGEHKSEHNLIMKLGG